MYNTIAIENMSTPAVALHNNAFIPDSKSAASGREMPGLRGVSEPVPCECTVTEEIEAGINTDVIDNIVAALTKPLTSEEASPTKEVERVSRVVFNGSHEEVNRFYYKRGWTDGLPIDVPTEEAVAEMLTGTDLSRRP